MAPTTVEIACAEGTHETHSRGPFDYLLELGHFTAFIRTVSLLDSGSVSASSSIWRVMLDGGDPGSEAASADENARMLS